MKRLKVFLPAMLLIFTADNIFGEIRLPSIFGNNMVLQQNSKVRLCGNATKNAVVNSIMS